MKKTVLACKNLFNAIYFSDELLKISLKEIVKIDRMLKVTFSFFSILAFLLLDSNRVMVSTTMDDKFIDVSTYDG